MSDSTAKPNEAPKPVAPGEVKPAPQNNATPGKPSDAPAADTPAK
jgi:hypothetical protein